VNLKNIKIGLAITGSFCTLNSFLPQIKALCAVCDNVTPIFSESVSKLETRFSTADERKTILEGITGRPAITSIVSAEEIGPGKLFDILVIAPCTGNTLAKIANAITDTTTTMAAKAHLRNNRPVLIGLSTNDGLGANARNLGFLLNIKNIYFIPFYQDDPALKPKSITFKDNLLIESIASALNNEQIQPVISQPPTADEFNN